MTRAISSSSVILRQPVRLTLVVLAGARRRSAFDEGANVAILEPALAEERREGKKEREEREGQGGGRAVMDG